MDTSKRIGIIVAVIVFAAAAFAGGMLLGRGGASGALPGAPGAMAAGPDGQRGPMADLTEAEQAEIEGMTETERQEFFQKKMGGQAPGGGAGGPGRGGLLEGELTEVASDTITVKLKNGTQNIYYDADTTIGYEEGAGKLASGSSVIVVSEPAADGVVNATAILVKK